MNATTKYVKGLLADARLSGRNVYWRFGDVVVRVVDARTHYGACQVRTLKNWKITDGSGVWDVR